MALKINCSVLCDVMRCCAVLSVVTPYDLACELVLFVLLATGDGDDEDPDVMLGTQPGGSLKNVSFRVRNR